MLEAEKTLHESRQKKMMIQKQLKTALYGAEHQRLGSSTLNYYLT
jgi:hypothetical protein